MGSTSALDAVHGLSTGAKYIEKNGMELILLLMTPSWAYLGPSWVQLAAILSQLKVVVVRIGPSPRLSKIIEQIVQ